MDLIKLEIHGISYSENLSGAFALVLNESKGIRKLPVVIGGFEAQAIALALQKNIKTSRPLTHELFKGFADKFEIKLKKVIIHKLVDGVFFSNMVCEKDGDTVIIDSRTSDAIAMALRFNAPIFTYESILNEVGFESDFKYEKKIGAPHHDHMICIETGKIIEFVDSRIEDIQDEIAEKYGYKIIKHVHQLFVKPIKK